MSLHTHGLHKCKHAVVSINNSVVLYMVNSHWPHRGSQLLVLDFRPQKCHKKLNVSLHKHQALYKSEELVCGPTECARPALSHCLDFGEKECP